VVHLILQFAPKKTHDSPLDIAHATRYPDFQLDALHMDRQGVDKTQSGGTTMKRLIPLVALIAAMTASVTMAQCSEKKAECKKAECKKAECEKKAECKKAGCEKKAECKKAEGEKK